MSNIRLQHSILFAQGSDFKGAYPVGNSKDYTPDEYLAHMRVDAVTAGTTVKFSNLDTINGLVLRNASGDDGATEVDAWAVVRSTLFTAVLTDVDFTVGPPGTIVDGAAGAAFAGWPDLGFARVTACSESANIATFKYQALTDNNTLTLAEAEVPTVLTAGTATIACDVEAWIHLPAGTPVMLQNIYPTTNMILYTASSTAPVEVSYWGT